MTDVAVDTSVAIPLLVDTHRRHVEVRESLRMKQPRLSGHALAETYSVLTRLPGDVRLSPEDAAWLMEERLGSPYLLSTRTYGRLPASLARLGIVGGAVYDALVALAAHQHDVPLATRDGRAKSTYEAVGVQTLVVG